MNEEGMIRSEQSIKIQLSNMSAQQADRVISFLDQCDAQLLRSQASIDENKRCLCISGQLRDFSDMELWNALRTRGALEKIILKFGDHGERQKGYAFAIFLTEEEACQALEQGRELRVGRRRVWLELSQRNACLAVCDIPLMCRVDDLVCEMSSFGQVVDLDVGMVGGMRTAFVEFSSRKEAEIAKLQIQRYFFGIRGMKVAWVDSKVLNNSI
ncbi:MAG: hypothetical protein EZS28_003921 [Streblomastix strix]|uniref:RRM domain-containing protein n=1 Tax=Streblomastix strix TaxID=222440 RepID=A0A5J4WZL0_9EUKA|nr:MAG: hypothetical protein EZS28_003921 [Streblomastix strix]